MIKLPFLVAALLLCLSLDASSYYSSSESSSEIIGYSPDFARLFPEFRDVSTSFTSSSSSKGHKLGIHDVDSVDGFSGSDSDGFKLVSTPSDGLHRGSTHTAGSSQTAGDDVLPFPSELADFWSSQLVSTPASSSSSHLRSSSVVYSSSSRTPILQNTHEVYQPSPVSDGLSHQEDNSHAYSSRYTPYDSSNTLSPLKPSAFSDGYNFEFKSERYPSKAPVFETTSSQELRLVADGNSLVESSGGTTSRSSTVPGFKITPGPGHLYDGFTLSEVKSDGNRKVFESKLVADRYTLEESNPVKFSSTVEHFKDSQSKHDESDADITFTKTTTLKPDSAIKTTTVKPLLTVKTTTVKPVLAVKTTTVKPVSDGFFNKFNNGGNFAIQRPRKTEDFELTSTRPETHPKKTHEPVKSTYVHSDLNTDPSRRNLFHSSVESDSANGEQDFSTIRNNDDSNGGDQHGVLAYLVSEEGKPGSDFLLTKSALIQSGLVFNKVVRMSANTVDAGGQVEILDSRSFHLSGLRYAGPGPARWIAGTTFPVGLYSDTVVLASWTPGVVEEQLVLPGQVSVADISWLALYCSTCKQGKVVMQVYIPETFL